MSISVVASVRTQSDPVVCQTWPTSAASLVEANESLAGWMRHMQQIDSHPRLWLEVDGKRTEEDSGILMAATRREAVAEARLALARL